MQSIYKNNLRKLDLNLIDGKFDEVSFIEYNLP